MIEHVAALDATLILRVSVGHHVNDCRAWTRSAGQLRRSVTESDMKSDMKMHSGDILSPSNWIA